MIDSKTFVYGDLVITITPKPERAEVELKVERISRSTVKTETIPAAKLGEYIAKLIY